MYINHFYLSDYFTVESKVTIVLSATVGASILHNIVMQVREGTPLVMWFTQPMFTTYLIAR